MVAMSSSPSPTPRKLMHCSRHMETQPPSSRASCRVSVPITHLLLASGLGASTEAWLGRAAEAATIPTTAGMGPTRSFAAARLAAARSPATAAELGTVGPPPAQLPQQQGWDGQLLPPQPVPPQQG